MSTPKSMHMPTPWPTSARADSIPRSSDVAVPPPSPTHSLPTYSWDVVQPSSQTVDPNAKSPPSPVFSFTETYVDNSAVNPHTGPFGRTYIFWVIPSRIGVAALSSLMFVCSIGMAAGAGFIANRLEGNLNAIQRLAIIFQILNYVFVTITSLVGLYAVLSYLHRNAPCPITRAYTSSQLFCGLLLGHLPFSVASGALSIHIVFKATNIALKAGIMRVEESISKEIALNGIAREILGRSAVAAPEKPLACWALEGTPLHWLCGKTKTIKAMIVCLYLALWFLEVVALYAGTRYSSQLHSVEMIKNVEDEEAANY